MKVFKVLGFIVLVVFSFSLHAAKYDKKVDPSKPKDADGWTLYAFTQRKLKNYRKAEANYEKALELDPENKIALEYQGELFVETERLGLAQVNLNKLKELCPTSCDELEQLRKYINQEAEKSL